LTEDIIGCAYEVHNNLEFGYLESVYENSLHLELRSAGLKASSQVPLTVEYRDETVGDFIADLVVEDKIILELKSVEELHQRHEVQLVSYLTTTGFDVGLLINFGPDSVDVRRKVRDL
jgi:GxxExxY protein